MLGPRGVTGSRYLGGDPCGEKNALAFTRFKNKGLARDRTGIDGIRIRRDSHYTTKPKKKRIER